MRTGPCTHGPHIVTRHLTVLLPADSYTMADGASTRQSAIPQHHTMTTQPRSQLGGWCPTPPAGAAAYLRTAPIALMSCGQALRHQQERPYQGEHATPSSARPNRSSRPVCSMQAGGCTANQWLDVTQIIARLGTQQKAQWATCGMQHAPDACT
jgi:hypothetical protein